MILEVSNRSSLSGAGLSYIFPKEGRRNRSVEERGTNPCCFCTLHVEWSSTSITFNHEPKFGPPDAVWWWSRDASRSDDCSRVPQLLLLLPLVLLSQLFFCFILLRFVSSWKIQASRERGLPSMMPLLSHVDQNSSMIEECKGTLCYCEHSNNFLASTDDELIHLIPMTPDSWAQSILLKAWQPNG